MNKQFQEIEEEFNRLKRVYRQRKISEREYKDRLKALRIRDLQGKCWTIGARTGKWYFFDGKNWIESKPPSLQDHKAVCIYCGYENNLETERCIYCGGTLDETESPDETDVGEPEDQSEDTGGDQPRFESSSMEEAEDISEDGAAFNHLLRSVSLLSFSLLMGGFGLILGIVLGVFTGTMEIFDPVVKTLPLFLQQRQGNLIGGIVFGILGGVAGFAFLGLLGFLQALLINFILSFTGGIRIRLDATERSSERMSS